MICAIHGYFEGWCDDCRTTSEREDEEIQDAVLAGEDE